MDERDENTTMTTILTALSSVNKVFISQYFLPRPHRTTTALHLSWETSPPHHRLPTVSSSSPDIRDYLRTFSSQSLNSQYLASSNPPVISQTGKGLTHPPQKRPSPARQANKPKPPPTISLCTALRRVGFTGCSPVSLSRMSCGERSAGRTGPGERGHTHTGIHIDTVHNTRARCLLPCAAAVGAVNSRCACPVRICGRPRKAR